MYICIYLYIHTYTYIHTYIYICVCVYICIYIYTHICINVYISIYIRVYTHTLYIYMYIKFRKTFCSRSVTIAVAATLSNKYVIPFLGFTICGPFITVLFLTI